MRPIPSVPYARSQGMQSSFIFFTMSAKLAPAIRKDRMMNMMFFMDYSARSICFSEYYNTI